MVRYLPSTPDSRRCRELAANVTATCPSPRQPRSTVPVRVAAERTTASRLAIIFTDKHTVELAARPGCRASFNDVFVDVKGGCDLGDVPRPRRSRRRLGAPLPARRLATNVVGWFDHQRTTCSQVRVLCPQGQHELGDCVRLCTATLGVDGNGYRFNGETYAPASRTAPGTVFPNRATRLGTRPASQLAGGTRDAPATASG